MKKIYLILVLVTLTSLTAQSLRDNPYYIKSLALKNQSEQAFSEGDYEKSTQLANESIEYANKSDEWIEMMLNKYKANSALNRTKKRLHYAIRVNGEVTFPTEMENGKLLYEQANRLYTEEKYAESYPIAKKAYEILSVIKHVKNITTLPAAYVVKDVPGNEDCLWKIAEYDFIFGDAQQWKILYEANRDILPQTDNPDLILAGLTLQIPSINGEVRAGTWVDGNIQ